MALHLPAAAAAGGQYGIPGKLAAYWMGMLLKSAGGEGGGLGG
ncbi:MAG: hypothetical protein ACK4IR_00720 [Thermosynechococcus sp.]